LHSPVVLVTGASGFVGRHLIPYVRHRGWQVRALVRGQQDAAWADSVAYVSSLRDEEGIREAMAGCDAVVHLAGLAHVVEGAPWEAYRVANVDGTRILAQQAQLAGVRRFVFMSSVKVLGDRSTSHPLTDADTPAPGDAYARSKLEAEQALMQITHKTGLEAVVLRPPLVYGPGVKANFLALLRTVDRFGALPFGGLVNRRSFCYVGNLVDMVLASLTEASVVGRSFLVADPETLELREFIRRLARTLGRSTFMLPIPPELYRIAGALVGRSEAVSKLTESFEIDSSGFAKASGWQAPFSIEAGLVETANWHLAHHGAA